MGVIWKVKVNNIFETIIIEEKKRREILLGFFFKMSFYFRECLLQITQTCNQIISPRLFFCLAENETEME